MDNKPKRIQRQRTKGWKMPEGAVYVGRPTKWGNMYEVGKSYDVRDVDDSSVVAKVSIETADHAVEMYRETLEAYIYLGDLDPEELRGKDLACWCPLDQPCHAEILLEFANQEDPS